MTAASRPALWARARTSAVVVPICSARPPRAPANRAEGACRERRKSESSARPIGRCPPTLPLLIRRLGSRL
eukprot:scaffold292877_cov32-Tisochrysis_lutea.AAC.3